MARKVFTLERLSWIAGIGAAVAAAFALLRRDSASGACTEDALRKRVVDYARTQVGKRELDRYFSDAAPQYAGQSPAWCGIFALHCLHQAGLAKNKQWKTGLGFLEVPPRLPNTTDPKPGDIAYFDNLQHHAIVGANHGDGTIELINGNGKGGVVSVSNNQLSQARAYYSISKLIEQAIAKGCE